MNNESFLIENSIIELGKSICKYITDSKVRSQALANVLAAKLAESYFQDVAVDTTSGIHNVFQIHEKEEIADIYINDAHIDVRVYFNEDEILIPKSHFEKNITPMAYMFIKLNEDLSGGLVTGFVLPNNIDTSCEYNGYYKVKEQDLVSFYDVEPYLIADRSFDLPEEFDAWIFEYLDNRLENVTEFFQTLFNCQEAREKFAQAASVQNIFNFVSIAEKADSEEIPESLQEDATDDGFSDISLTESFDSTDSLEEFETQEVDSLDMDNSLEEFDELDNIDELVEESPVLETEEVSEFENLLEDSGEVIEEIAPDNVIEESEDVIEDTLEETASAEESLEEVEETATEEGLSEEITENITEENITEDLSTDSFEYSTTTSPSLETIEAESSDDELDEIAVPTEENIENEVVEDVAQVEEADIFEKNQEDIDALYNDIPTETAEDEMDNLYTDKPKKKSKALPMLSLLAILGALGYYGYTKFVAENQGMPALPESQEVAKVQPTTNTKPQKEAMPVETVENVKTTTTNEGNAVSIPAIEKNLDASILVSNLGVNWEVPAGYVSNNTAKRYFTKMGKIIQLNLKTELLLLSKPPITNKIALELEFNKNIQQFSIKGITISSGEKSVDEVIVQTVNTALSHKLNTNMSVFANIQGNPVLVIRL